MLEKKPFVNYSLDEEKKDKPDIISLRLTDEERKKLNTTKLILNIPSDGTALKIMAEIGLNVIHSTFPPKILAYLTKEKRVRIDETSPLPPENL